MSGPAVHLYRFEGDWRASGHTLLVLLSRYVPSEPDEIRLRRTDKGKPYVEDSDIFFNLSHTVNLTVVAIAQGVEVGVDVEAMEARVDPLAIASRFFHPAERAALAALESAAQLDLFFRIWVRKEAFVKGVGGGLSMGLDKFRVYPDCAGIEPWSIADIEVGSGYAAALAVKEPRFEIQWRQFGCGRI